MSQPSSSGFRKLFTDCVALIRSWWQVDRIRIAPAEGRILRLQPGSVIVVQGRPVKVVSRKVKRDGERVSVAYHCRGAEGDGQLIVTVSDCGDFLISWTVLGRTQSIEESDFTIYSERRRDR